MAEWLVWPPYMRPQNSLEDVLQGLGESRQIIRESLLDGNRQQRLSLLKWSVGAIPYYQKNPAYKELLKSFLTGGNEFEDIWRQLPVLQKAELRAHGDQIRCEQVPENHRPLGQVNTSGSTGIPVEIFGTAPNRRNWAALTLFEQYQRRRDFSGRLAAVRYLNSGSRGPEGIRLSNWGGELARRVKTGPGFGLHISHPPERILTWLRRVDPHYVLTYPSVLNELLPLVSDRRRMLPALREVCFMSEPLDSELRERLEKEWAVEVVELYSANECGYMGLPCSKGKLHVPLETLWLELLNEEGEPCRVGEQGRVVVTNLHNLATPLLRYEIGDYARWGTDCSCGYQGPVIESVLGRVRNYATSPSGQKFWPESLGKIRAVSAIRQFQYVQTDRHSIELRVVLDDELSAEDQRKAGELAREALGHDYDISVVQMDSINRGPTGKYEEFLSKLED